MSQPIIEVRNLGKRYQLGAIGMTSLRDEVERLWQRIRQPRPGGAGRTGRSSEFWALRGVSFDVQPGEVVGIIGRNGAGKSTLLKILSRITQQTEGEVTLRGRVASLLEVGTGFHPELSGRENIFLNGAILGMTKAEIKSKFDEIVAFAEVDQFIDTPVKRYSSGMYVRLAFAVAAHLEPEILIVDEVLAVGDVAFQQKCLGQMSRMAKSGGRTVVFVSHNMSAVRTLCGRAALLDGGRLTHLGTAEDAISTYLASFTAGRNAFVRLPSGIDPRIEASWLRILNSRGAPETLVLIGEPWRIRLEFEVRQPMSHVIAAVGLMTAESVPLITYWSRPQDLQPGSYHVEFVCDLPLAAGDVTFNVGLSTHTRTTYYAQGIGHLRVSEVSTGVQPLRSSGAGLLLGRERPPIVASAPAVAILPASARPS
jgi:homopolymeric O-antigen transport system ATP-binding protein